MLADAIILLFFILYFSLAGYESDVSIKELSNAHFIDIEKEASLFPNRLTEYLNETKKQVDNDEMAEIYQLLFGRNCMDAHNVSFKFSFSIGDKLAILEVVKLVNQDIPTNIFAHSSASNGSSKQSKTKETMAGRLFSSDECLIYQMNNLGDFCTFIN